MRCVHQAVGSVFYILTTVHLVTWSTHQYTTGYIKLMNTSVWYVWLHCAIEVTEHWQPDAASAVSFSNAASLEEWDWISLSEKYCEHVSQYIGLHDTGTFLTDNCQMSAACIVFLFYSKTLRWLLAFHSLTGILWQWIHHNRHRSGRPKTTRVFGKPLPGRQQ